MGVKSLPKELRGCGGMPETRFNTPGMETHVDFAARFFRLVQTRVFNIVQRRVKNGSLKLLEEQEPCQPLNTHTVGDTRKRRIVNDQQPATSPPENRAHLPYNPTLTLDELIEEAIRDLDLKDVYTHEDGLSSRPRNEDRLGYGAVAYVLDAVLSKVLEKKQAVLHIDGKPSEQKRQEHRRRNMSLAKSLAKLTDDVAKPRTKPTRTIINRSRNIYRTPRSIMDTEVFPVLVDLGWTLHRCNYQADTCLALVCQQSPDPSRLILITRDSDIIVYEGVQSITVPVGRGHELITTTKKSLLQHMDLPSEQHLLLACLVTSNDYVRNIPYFGLSTNCDIVRDMDLSELPSLGTIDNNEQRANEIVPYIQEYIDQVNSRLLSQRKRSKARKGRRGIPVDIDVNHYRHAITAFVHRTESDMMEPIEDIDKAPPAHEIVVSALEHLYNGAKEQQQHHNTSATIQSMEDDPDTTSGMEAATSTTLANSPPPSATIRPSGSPKRKRSMKQQQRRLDRLRQHRKLKSRYKKWCTAKFKSRTDKDARYSVRKVTVAEARMVDPDELAKMTPSLPRTKKTTEKPPPGSGPLPSASPSNTSSSTGSTSSSSGKTITVGTLSNASAKTGSKKPKRKSRKRPKPKAPVPARKAAFAGAFATSTQTLGSLRGCFRRALLPLSESGDTESAMDDDDFTALAGRLSDATDTMNRAAAFVYRMLEITIWEELSRIPNGSTGGRGQPETEFVMDQVTLTQGKAIITSGLPDSPEAAREEFDILDLVLVKASGMALVKHMFSLALNGKMDGRGPRTKKAPSMAVKAVAQRAYCRLLEFLPGFQPANTHHIQLGRPVIAAAQQVIVNLRTHFRKMPFTIGSRMLKYGWAKNDLPAGSFKEDESSDDADRMSVEETGQEDDHSDAFDENDNEEEEEEEEEEDASTRFPPGYILHWWTQATRLPSSARPIFCLRKKLKSCFVTFEERSLPQILWGTTQKNPNPAFESALKIMSAKEAAKMAEDDYGSLVKKLFYGDRAKIRESGSVWQTTYGKRTTTMSDLANTNSDVYGTAALQTYLTNKFEYISQANFCREQQRPCDRAPPPLPTDITTDRYALSNIISTNGLRLHTLCFDTTMAYRPRNPFAPIYRIERRFPTLQSILQEFGVETVDDIDVWGVDPGEVNPAAFCRLERTLNGSTNVGTSTDKDILNQPENDHNSPVLSPAITAHNLVVSRLALYSPILAHRNQMDTIKMLRPVVAPGQEISGHLWTRASSERDHTAVSLPSIKDVENLLPPYQHDVREDLETATQRFFQVRPILQDFYASDRIRKLDWELDKWKQAEVDWAIDAVLSSCTRKTLFCYGNGKFRTGLNLASPHESFKGRFAQKAVATGHVVVLVDEMLTSTMCPACVELGVTSRLAKPTIRSCACLNCGRWLHRDIVGGHNLAIVGETWIRDFTRPAPLCRQSDAPLAINSNNLPNSN